MDLHKDVLMFRYAFFHTDLHYFLEILTTTLRKEVTTIAVDDMVIGDQWWDMEDELATHLPGLEKLYVSRDTDGSTAVIKEKGVLGFRAFSDSELPEKRLNVGKVYSMILETKTRHPDWNEPVMKIGEYILGSANADSGFPVILEDEDEQEVVEDDLESDEEGDGDDE